MSQRYTDHYYDWVFDHKIIDVWAALFTVEANEESSDHPPFVVLHALDCLLPAPADEPPSSYDVLRRQLRWDTKLTYTAETNSASIEGVVSALTQELHPKLLIVTAEIQDKHDTSPAVFVILMSSPLWYNFKERREECQTGTQHFILQILPQARALWCTQEDILLKDVVKRATDTLSFGSSSRTMASSGLSINLRSGVLTLCSKGSSSNDVYVEIDINPSMAATPTQQAEPWQTVAKMQNLEVYDLSDGVRDELFRLQDESINSDAEQSKSPSASSR